MILAQAFFWAWISYNKTIDRYILPELSFNHSNPAKQCGWELLVISTYLIKFLAIFFFFKFLPVPVNLDILFMRWDDFVLNFVGSLLLVLLLEGAASGLPLIGFCFDLIDRAVSRSDQLFECAYTQTSMRELVVQIRGRIKDLPLASSILISPFLGTSTLSETSFLSPNIYLPLFLIIDFI